jgi:hypothetical protein
MIDVAGFIRKAVDKSGFVRERFNDQNIPTDPSNICVLPFFGDIRSLFILSSLLLNRFRKEERGSKYFILCSWPGFESLFPYVDEYWGIKDQMQVKALYENTNHFENKSSIVSNFYRNLQHYFFEDLIFPEDKFKVYYNAGITDVFWKKYKQVLRFLPSISSSLVLGKDFNRDLMNRGGFKVFIYPTMFANSWRSGGQSSIHVPRDFWSVCIERLIKEGFIPVVYRGFLTYDISTEFTDKCIYVNETDMGKVFASMRTTGCVIDFFSGISKLALAARCPYVMLDERSRYMNLKEYEIDDLCGQMVPKQYIFSFSTIIEKGNRESWEFDLLNCLISRLKSFLPELDRDNLPSTGESEEIVSYNLVRKRKLKKFGTRFIKVARL